MKHVLTIAGSDSGAGAGIQADLKTFSALKVYGLTVITAITAQNSRGVSGIENLSPRIVDRQLVAIFSDIRVDVVKIGMVSHSEIIEVIAARLAESGITKIILDPVMVSGTGHKLLESRAIDLLVSKLFSQALLVTPNILETEELVNNFYKKATKKFKIDSPSAMKEAARIVAEMGPKNVLIKGGHLAGKEAVDIFYNGQECQEIKGPRIKTTNTHGTGCTYSSAIAAYRARGLPLAEAVIKAKKYITGAIKNSFKIGQGAGPTHHFFRYYR